MQLVNFGILLFFGAGLLLSMALKKAYLDFDIGASSSEHELYSVNNTFLDVRAFVRSHRDGVYSSVSTIKPTLIPDQITVYLWGYGIFYKADRNVSAKLEKSGAEEYVNGVIQRFMNTSRSVTRKHEYFGKHSSGAKMSIPSLIDLYESFMTADGVTEVELRNSSHSLFSHSASTELARDTSTMSFILDCYQKFRVPDIFIGSMIAASFFYMLRWKRWSQSISYWTFVITAIFSVLLTTCLFIASSEIPEHCGSLIKDGVDPSIPGILISVGEMSTLRKYLRLNLFFNIALSAVCYHLRHRILASEDVGTN